MRVPRIKESGEGFYHTMSRVVDRRMVLDDKEKERFRKLLRNAAAFSGVDVLTHSIMDNHFHLILHVPERQPVGDLEFSRRRTRSSTASGATGVSARTCWRGQYRFTAVLNRTAVDGGIV